MPWDNPLASGSDPTEVRFYRQSTREGWEWVKFPHAKVNCFIKPKTNPSPKTSHKCIQCTSSKMAVSRSPCNINLCSWLNLFQCRACVSHVKEGKHVARRETNPVRKRLQDLTTLRITTQPPLAKSVFSCVCISRPVADPREIALSQTSKSEF